MVEFGSNPDACVMPVLELDEAPLDPHNKERGSFVVNSQGKFEPVITFFCKYIQNNTSFLQFQNAKVDLIRRVQLQGSAELPVLHALREEDLKLVNIHSKFWVPSLALRLMSSTYLQKGKLSFKPEGLPIFDILCKVLWFGLSLLVNKLCEKYVLFSCFSCSKIDKFKIYTKAKVFYTSYQLPSSWTTLAPTVEVPNFE